MSAPDIAAAVLAKASAYDNRRPQGTTIAERAESQRITVAAWAEALDDMTRADALDAVTEHYASTRDWLMPADINRIVATHRRARITADHSLGPAYPDGLGDDPALEAAWIAHRQEAIGQGATRTQAAAYAWERINRTPPHTLEATTHNVRILTNHIGKKSA